MGTVQLVPCRGWSGQGVALSGHWPLLSASCVTPLAVGTQGPVPPGQGGCCWLSQVRGDNPLCLEFFLSLPRRPGLFPKLCCFPLSGLWRGAGSCRKVTVLAECATAKLGHRETNSFFNGAVAVLNSGRGTHPCRAPFCEVQIAGSSRCQGASHTGFSLPDLEYRFLPHAADSSWGQAGSAVFLSLDFALCL